MRATNSNNRGRPWIFSPPAITLLILLVVPFVWLARSEPAGVQLGYGEFKQILQAPGVRFKSLHVGKTDIRGEILTRDHYSGAKPASDEKEVPEGQMVRSVTFQTPRQGLEIDTDLQRLLDTRAADVYQAEEDDGLMKGIMSFVFLGLTMGAVLLLTLMVIRWFSGGNSPFNFGRSRHRLYASKDQKVTFQDVAGIDEAVAELREVVDFLKRPQKYQALGGRIPKGVLLVGPPGTGKTLLAKAVAGEADVPFFSLSGSDFVEMFVGVGASRVRDLFREAEAKAPCIVFIDELDALGRSRAGNNPHEEREQTLNALLVEMDGFDTNRGVIIMAATNRPEMLDQALLRPGRFDRHVVVDQPDINGREAILKVHARHVKFESSVDLRKIAALTSGSVGADLANLVNEAALLAARNSKSAVDMHDFNEAVDRSTVGLERKSRIMKPEEKRRVAVHEAGHAIVSCACPNSDPVHKVSIIPRGFGVLGYVVRRPEDDRHLHTRTELETNIKVGLGGTLAEELLYGDFSTGAANDLERVNQIARRMVKMFGMSPLGRIYHRDGDLTNFLPGVSDFAPRDHSEETAREIEMEVRRIIDNATESVREILARNQYVLDAVASRLVEKEVIDGAELHELLDRNGFAAHASAPIEANGVHPSENGNIAHMPASS